MTIVWGGVPLRNSFALLIALFSVGCGGGEETQPVTPANQAPKGSINFTTPSDGMVVGEPFISIEGTYSASNAPAFDIKIRLDDLVEFSPELLNSSQFRIADFPAFPTPVRVVAELVLPDGSVLASDTVSFRRSVNLLRSATIGSAGGIVADNDPGSTTQFTVLTVPANALEAEVVFEVSEPLDAAPIPAPAVAIGPYVTVDPKMVTFQHSATLSLPITDNTADWLNATVYAFDGAQWTTMPIINRNSTSVSIPLMNINYYYFVTATP